MLNSSHFCSFLFFFLPVLTDFQQDETFKGFIHENGELKVTENGVYYIYAQVFFEHSPSSAKYHNRVALTVNGNSFGLMQTGLENNADYGSLFTGGVTKLKEGDLIGLKTVYESRIWVSRAHTFFGAYRVSLK